MIEVHLKKLRARADISTAEEQTIRGLIADVIEVEQDRTLVRHGQELRESLLLLDGWLGRAKDLRDGQRQLAELHVPGDFADLHGFTLKHLEHDVISLTKCRIATVPHERLKALTEQHPRLTRIYWFMTNIDAAIHREWTLSLGRRSALERMAHLLCELNVRLELAGAAENNSYQFPLTQAELGECLGLTAVHVNRTLQELRRTELVEVRGRRVQILDLSGLQRLAEFDDAYLYLEKREH